MPNPSNRFVADFIGVTNLLPVRVVAPAASAGMAGVETAWGAPSRLRCRERLPLAVGSAAFLTVRPEDIVLHTAGTITAEDVLVGQVRDLIYLRRAPVYHVGRDTHRIWRGCYGMTSPAT